MERIDIHIGGKVYKISPALRDVVLKVIDSPADHWETLYKDIAPNENFLVKAAGIFYFVVRSSPTGYLFINAEGSYQNRYREECEKEECKKFILEREHYHFTSSKKMYEFLIQRLYT